MKQCFFLIGLLFLSTQANSACDQDKNILGASYRIESKDLATGKIVAQNKLNYWRLNKRVAYENLGSHITQVWSLVSNGQIKLDRYFDQPQRGIEYQPAELNNGKGDNNWDAKYQIIGNEAIKKMTLLSTDTQNCDVIQTYSLQEAGQKTQLTWLDSTKLPKKLSYIKNGHEITWQLQKLILDKEQVKENFTRRDNFQSTDYADIGDNESDPFLLKMINLGFIDHSEAGVYSSNGQPMGITGEHHH